MLFSSLDVPVGPQPSEAAPRQVRWKVEVARNRAAGAHITHLAGRTVCERRSQDVPGAW
jgi:hypothetical protein